MLGTLARWLRMLGYDTAYAANEQDKDLQAIAAKSGRILLTRDKALAERASGIYLAPDLLENQLRVLRERFALALDYEAIRCSVCNGDLEPLDRAALPPEVPEGAREAAKSFWRCTACGKAYWDGSHWRNILERLRRLGIPTAPSGSTPR